MNKIDLIIVIVLGLWIGISLPIPNSVKSCLTTNPQEAQK